MSFYPDFIKINIVLPLSSLYFDFIKISDKISVYYKKSWFQPNFTLPKGICKTCYNNQDFPHLTNGVYLVVINKKNHLHNENSHFTEPITKMGVA